MATVSDNANRANGALGPNWTAQAGVTGGLTIVNSTFSTPNTNGTYASYWSANTFGNDQYTEADIPAPPSGSSMGLLLRWTPGSLNGYLFLQFRNDFDPDPSARSTYGIFRITAGGSTALASTTAPTTGTSRITAEIEGTALRMYDDGVLVLSTTDATHSTGSRVGLLVSRFGATPSLDNWEGGDLAPPATIPATISDLAGTPASTEVTLTWTAPADGGSAITDYEYRVDGGTWTSTASATPGFAITGLTNGVEYDFEVRAINAVGSGLASNLASVTPVAPPPHPGEVLRVGSFGTFAAATNAVITTPAGTDDGNDLLLLFGGAFHNSGTPTAPLLSGAALTADFTRQASVTATATSGSHLEMWSRTADGTEDASYSPTYTYRDSYGSYGMMLRVRNAELQTTNGGVYSTLGTANAEGDIPAHTVDEDGSLAVFSLIGYNNAIDTAAMAAAGYTQLTTSWDGNFGTLWAKRVNAGSVAEVSNIQSGGDNLHAGMLVILRPAGAPIEVATDDFNRADGGLGANWTTLATAPSIVGNAVQGPVDQTEYTAAWTADTFEDDQWAKIDATLGPGYSEAAVGARLSGTSGYFFVWSTETDAQYRVFRVVGGTWTQIASTSATTTGTRRLRIEVVDTTITCYADGVEVLSTTDGSLGSGDPGFEVYKFNAAGSSALLDNFSAGDWSAGQGPEPAVNLKFGDTQLVGLALGDTVITKAYLGDTLLIG